MHNLPITMLGKAKILSPLQYCNIIQNPHICLHIDHDYLDKIEEKKPLLLETAGPSPYIYFNPQKTCCAIVTCGGLCPGINDVIRAIVFEAFDAYGIHSILGIPYGLEGFIPQYNHTPIHLTPKNVAQIHRFGGSLLGSSRGPQTPKDIVDTLERFHINILFVIGGDGSMRAANTIYKELQKRNLPISIIGIPKTIDNDISFVPKSFGFDTAVEKATEAIGCAHVEAICVKNGIGIVKLMGRESGFIAVQAALALREANFVLIPEAPFQLYGDDGFLAALEKRLVTKSHAVVVVAEGAGQHLLNEVQNQKDISGNLILGDIGIFLKNTIKTYFMGKNIPIQIKYIDPSYLIRSIPANTNDKIYCGFLGQHAVHAAMAGKTNMVIANIMDTFVHIPLNIVIKKRRKLDIYSGLWQSVLEYTGQGSIAGMLPSCNT